MNNVFLELSCDLFVNVDHVTYVEFTEDDILGDSVLAISLNDGSEITFTLFDLVEDNDDFKLVLNFLDYLKLFNLANTIGSYVHDLRKGGD